MVPTLGACAAEFKVPVSSAADLQAYNVLTQGLGNMIWVPCMLNFGKRWTIIASSILFVPCIAWCARARSYESLLAGRVMAGSASGASESFGPAIISDLWYEHNLATALGGFTLSILAGVGIGQVAIGYITTAIRWRWANWVTFIVVAINLLTMLFWLPETTYQRGLAVGVTAGDVQRHQMAEDMKLENRSALGGTDGTVQMIETAPEPLVMKNNFCFIRHAHVDYRNNWLASFLHPFRFFISPVALWSSLTYSVAAGAFTVAGVCVPQMFGPPPCSFGPAAQGLFSLSALVGVSLGGTIGSKSVDIVSNRLEQRRFKNGKEHKPEGRLVMLFLPFCTAGTGLVMYGFTIERTLPWIAPSVGYAMLAFGLTTMGSICLSYNLDAYLVRSGEISVFNNIVRALISFGFTELMPTWLEGVGAAKAYSILAGILWGLVLFGIPVFFFGPQMRAATNRFL